VIRPFSNVSQEIEHHDDHHLHSSYDRSRHKNHSEEGIDHGMMDNAPLQKHQFQLDDSSWDSKDIDILQEDAVRNMVDKHLGDHTENLELHQVIHNQVPAEPIPF